VHTLFFGERWDAPMVDDAQQVPTPIGLACFNCTEPVVEGDRGLIRTVVRMVDGEPVGSAEPTHAECDLIGVMGHQMGVCSCTGYDTTTRAAAQVLWQRIGEERGRDLADRG